MIIHIVSANALTYCIVKSLLYMIRMVSYLINSSVTVAFWYGLLHGLTQLSLVSHICIIRNSSCFPSEASFMHEKSLSFSVCPWGRPRNHDRPRWVKDYCKNYKSFSKYCICSLGKHSFRYDYIYFICRIIPKLWKYIMLLKKIIYIFGDCLRLFFNQRLLAWSAKHDWPNAIEFYCPWFYG